MQTYRVTFVSPSGMSYQLTGSAADEADAVSRADRTLEYVERIGISDYLQADGVTVEPPARLSIEGVEPTSDASDRFSLIITDQHGAIRRTWGT